MEVYYETMKRILQPYRAEAKKWLAAEKLTLGRTKYEVSLAFIEEAILEEAKKGTDIFDITLPFRIPVLQKLHSLVVKVQGVPDANSVVCEGWQRACIYAAGEKVFEVSPNLSDFLWATDIRNVQCDLLRLPYKSLYIRVPKRAGLVIPADLAQHIAEDEGIPTAGETTVEGMFITESYSVDDDRERAHTRVGRYISDVPIEVHTEPQVRRSWVFTVVAGGSDTVMRGQLKDKTFYVFEFPLPKKATIEQAIHERDNYISDPEFQAKYRADSVWRKYFEWAMNVMLYVTYEPNPDIEEYWANKDAMLLKRRIQRMPEGKEKKRLKERLKALDLQKRIYVGRHHCLLEEAEHVEVERPPGSGVPLAVRILVTGHWRNQACGTGWQDHILRWIKPYWKGPKGAPISNARRIVT